MKTEGAGERTDGARTRRRAGGVEVERKKGVEVERWIDTVGGVEGD